MIEKELVEDESYYKKIRAVLENGQPLPEDLVDRQPQGVSIVPGPNTPEHPPGTSMEGGVPVNKE